MILLKMNEQSWALHEDIRQYRIHSFFLVILLNCIRAQGMIYEVQIGYQYTITFAQSASFL